MNLPEPISLRRLWYDPAQADTYEALLAPEEQERVQTFKHPRRRASFTLGRVAARTLLGTHLGLQPVEVPLMVAPDGGVEVEGHPLHLSIAHAGDMAAACVAPHPIGVDLERIVPRRADLYRFILHPEEYNLLDALPMDHNEIQILCWCLKEAVLKAQRTGFRCSPKHIRLDINTEMGEARAVVKAETHWALRYASADGYYTAVAYPAEVA